MIERVKAHGRSLVIAVRTDLPWSPSRSRSTLFLLLLIAGIVGGILQGGLLYRHCLEVHDHRGDAHLWGAVTMFGWNGLAVGLAAGMAMTVSRHWAARLLIASVLGALTVGAVTSWRFADLPESGEYPLYDPRVCGLRLGAATAGALALGAHLLRRSAQGRLFIVYAVPVVALLLHRALGLYWDEWNANHFDGFCSMSRRPRFPLWQATGALTATLTAALLLGSWLERRIRPLILLSGLGAVSLLTIGGLGWAAEAMPFTPPSRVDDVTFWPDGEFVGSIHHGNTLRLWKVERPKGRAAALREIRKERLGEGRSGWDYVVHPKLVAAWSWEGRIAFWDPVTFREFLVTEAPGDHGVLTIASDGRTVAVIGRHRTELWVLADTPEGGLSATKTILAGEGTEEGWISALFSIDGRILLRTKKGEIGFYDRLTGKKQATIPIEGGIATPKVALAPDSRQVGLLYNGVVHVIDVATGRAVRDIDTGIPRTMGLKYSPDGRELLVQTFQSILILDVSSGRIVARWTLPDERTFTGATAFSPDGRSIVAGGHDGQVELLTRTP